MNNLFIELRQFSDRVGAFLTDEEYSTFQALLMANPNTGKVIPKTGGLRKIRYADTKRQKGKRGGIRIVYLHIPDANLIFMFDIYDKDSQENLNAADLKYLKKTVEKLKNESKERNK